MPGVHDKNIHRLDRNQGEYPMALLPPPVLGSLASLHFACEGFRASFSKATRREKDLATVSCERTGHGEFGSRREPMVKKAIRDCCHSHAVPLAGARFYPALKDRPRPDTGCNLLG